MKVLLCTITVGEGVNKICRAVAEKLGEQNIECEVFNVYENNKKRATFVSQSYYKAVKYVPHLLRAVQHKISNYHRPLNKFKSYKFVKEDVKVLKDVLCEKVNSGNFDVVYTPVQFIALSALLLRREGKINCKVVYNIPDFNLPIHTELCHDIDLIVSPSQEAKEDLVKYGFTEEKVKYFPVPMSEANFTEFSKEEVKKSLNIPDDKFVVLIMSGGAGFGNTIKALKTFQKFGNNLQYIVVNGRNEKQKQAIDKLIAKKNWDNVVNFGFSKIVPQLMSGSDCLFTKVGAATMCEAYAKNLAIITTQQKLYPEYDNLNHLVKYNAAKKCKNLKDCAKTFNLLKENPTMLEEMKKNMGKLFNKTSSEGIAKLIIKL